MVYFVLLSRIDHCTGSVWPPNLVDLPTPMQCYLVDKNPLFLLLLKKKHCEIVIQSVILTDDIKSSQCYFNLIFLASSMSTNCVVLLTSGEIEKSAPFHCFDWKVVAGKQ